MSSHITDETPSKIKEKDVPRILTVKQFCAENPWPTESAMRSYIFRAQELQMSEAFIRVGRRVLVNVNKFFNIIQKGDKKYE